MCEDAFLVCVYYFSLPEFPNDCTIVEDNSLLVRDILVSNPLNPHIKYGGQYDPHYEHDSAPEFKMCSKKTRRKVMSIVDDDMYDRIYLLFRTNRVALSKPRTQYITGYYDIDFDKVHIDPNYEEPVIYAKETRFVDLKSAINLSDFLQDTGNYGMPFSSETNGGSFKKLLDNSVEKIEKEVNHLDDYIKATKRLDRLLKYNEFEEGVYSFCHNCMSMDKCPLIKRIHKRGKLYHQLPMNIADKINRYYKRTIRM